MATEIQLGIENLFGADARGTADPGTANRIANIDAEASDAELRRADFRDAYRAGLISPLTDKALPAEEIPVLLARARQMVDGIKGDWGPRTQYAHASNLLTLYTHLLDRARTSPRDRDGALLTKDRFEKVIPWSADRINRVEDLPEFGPSALVMWNEIVALGPPPEYNPRRPWSGERKPKIKPIKDHLPRTGMGLGAGHIDLPLGMYAVIRPGGPDARIQFQMLKTPEMTMDSEDGRAAVLAAVIAQILQHKHKVDFYDTAAREMLRRETGSKRGVVYANDPGAFKKLFTTAEFRFEVGLSFLMHLDEVTGGGVPMKTINLLEPGIDVRKNEARPLWQELYPNNTRRERSQWAWKRMYDARLLYDPANRRPMPGHFYKGNQMFYVADGLFAGDQIWMTKDARLYAVNEREAMIEAFRQGVLAAAGMVAVAYIMIALALVLVEGPAIIATLARFIRAPVAVCKELLMVVRTKPLSVLGNLALEQGANVILSGGWDKYSENFGGGDTWAEMFLSVLMFARPKVIKLPSGAQLLAGNGEIKMLTAGSHATDAVVVPDVPLTTPLASGSKSGTLTPDTAVPVTTAPTQGAVTTPLKNPRPADTPGAVASPGASAVIRTDPIPAGTDVAPKRPPPDSAGDVPVRPPETAGDAPVKPPDTPTRRGTTDAERAIGDEKLANDTDIGVAEAAGGGGGGSRRGSRPRGAAGQRRQRRPGPAGGKRSIGERTRATGDRRGDGGGGRGGGGGGRRGPQDETIIFTRDSIQHRITVTPEARRAYDDIPVDNTVVYTVHNNKGEVVYVGITTKTDSRGAVNRLQEHLTTQDGRFISEANEFRIVGHYHRTNQPHQANALEHHLITTNDMPLYNRDLNTWQTHADYGGSMAERNAARPSRDLVDDVTRGLRPQRRKPVAEPEGNVPAQLDQPIRFGVNSDRAPGRPSRPMREPGVDPDFDN